MLDALIEFIGGLVADTMIGRVCLALVITGTAVGFALEGIPGLPAFAVWLVAAAATVGVWAWALWPRSPGESSRPL